MPSQKKLASLRLDPEVLDRIDAVIQKLYKDLPGAPSRNTVMEAWVTEMLEKAEREAKR